MTDADPDQSQTIIPGDPDPENALFVLIGVAIMVGVLWQLYRLFIG